MAWNRPHKLTANLDIRFDKDAPRKWAFLLKQTGINVFVTGQSGRSYTPMDIHDDHAIGLPNSKNAPVQFTTDLKISRWFKVRDRRFDISVQGNNIFNNYLIYRVDPVTGKGYVWGAGQFDPRQVRGVDDYARISKVDDPSNYSAGAQWRAQLDVDF